MKDLRNFQDCSAHEGEGLDRGLRGVLIVVAGVMTAGAAMVLTGWMTGRAGLVTLFWGGAPMVANTAICFLLTAAGIWGWVGKRLGVARGCWLIAMGLAAGVLVQFGLGRPTGIDEFFVRHASLTEIDAHGRMAPNTAVAFVCLELALLAAIARRRSVWAVLLLSAVPLGLSMLAVLGYVSGLRAAHSWGNFAGMALSTAVLLLLSGAAAVESVAGFRRRSAMSSPPALFTFALVLLLACGRMSLVMNAEVSTANDAVTRSYEYREVMQRFVLALTRMQATDRAFALTGEEYYAERHQVYMGELRNELLALERFAAEHASRQNLVEEVGRLVAQRIEQSESVMQARRRGDMAMVAKMLIPVPRRFSALMEQLQAGEDRLLESRREAMRRIERGASLVLAAGVAVAGLMLAAAFHLVQRARRASEKANEELEARVAARTDELRNREEGLRFVADAMPDMVWTEEADGGGERFNRSWIEYAGLPLEALRAEGWTKLLHADDVAVRLKEWEEARRAGRAGGGEFRLRRGGDGAHRWHRWHAQPQREGGGRIVRWAVIAVDIHDQKQAAEDLEKAVLQRTGELVAAKEQLEVSERLQRAVLDGTVYSVIATDPAGTITIFNTGAERMLGYHREEIVNQCSPAIIHDPAEVEARAEQLSVELGRRIAPGFEVFVARARMGEVEEREWSFVRKDGTRLPVMLSVTALRGREGGITGFLGLAHDLTLRKEAEAAVRVSRERLASIFGSMAEGIVMQGADSSILECNKAAERILGLTRDQLQGRSSLDPAWRAVREDGSAFPGTEHPAVVTLRTGEALKGVIMGVHKPGGALTWISINSEPLRDEGGQVRTVVCSFADISDRKEQERALQESEEHFRQAFDFAGIGMALVGLDGRWLRVNPALCAIVGYDAEALCAKTFQDITHPDDLKSDLALLRELLDGQRSHYQMEKRYFHGKGHEVWVRLTVSLVRDQGGRPVHFVSQIEDIARAREMEKSLATARDEALGASRLKSEFLANMSHEIRTPMNGVIGMSRLLLESTLDSEQRRMSQVVLNSAENLLTIINDILDFSKIEAGKMRLEPADFDLRDLVEETVTLLASQAREKGLEIGCEIDPGVVPGLIGDAGRIQQVLTNMLGNAIKFTERGSIAVAVRGRGGDERRQEIRIEVRDTGVGIAPAMQSRLFLPFMQAEGGAARKFGGTGLGLAICRQLVELMGGRFGFESEERKGSCFWFELSLSRQAGVSRGGVDLRAGLAVLIVERLEENQRILHGQIAGMGVAAEVAVDATEALAKLRKGSASGEPFRLALLDANMPGVDGIELAAAIRADASIAATVLVLLASSRPVSIDEAVARHRIESVLDKPVRESALRNVVLRVLGRPRTTAPFARLSATVATAAVPGGLRLLVAEDNRANQLVARLLLGKMGYQVEVVENGRLAVARLALGGIDGVLMDCQMPEMDGYEATRLVRAFDKPPANPRVPVIALTAYAMPGDRERCLAAGMDDYVTKPLEVAELVAAFERCGLGVPGGRKVEAVVAAPVKVSVESPAGGGLDVLDPSQLEQTSRLRGPKGRMLDEELAGMMLAEMPGRLAALKTQLAERRIEELARGAHTIAGSAASVGGKALRSVSRVLEDAVKAGHWPEAEKLLPAVEVEWKRLQEALKQRYPYLR